MCQFLNCWTGQILGTGILFHVIIPWRRHHFHFFFIKNYSSKDLVEFEKRKLTNLTFHLYFSLGKGNVEIFGGIEGRKQFKLDALFSHGCYSVWRIRFLTQLLLKKASSSLYEKCDGFYFCTSSLRWYTEFNWIFPKMTLQNLLH